jgi:hypothetical protein
MGIKPSRHGPVAPIWRRWARLSARGRCCWPTGTRAHHQSVQRCVERALVYSSRRRAPGLGTLLLRRCRSGTVSKTQAFPRAPRISSRDRHIGARRPPEDQGRRPPVSLHCVTARVSEPERHSSGPETAAHRRGRSRLRAAHRSRYYGGLRMNMIARTAMLAAARSPDHDSSSMPPGGMMPAGVIRAGPTGPNILR